MGVSETPAHARDSSGNWTKPQVLLAVALVLLGLAITVPAFLQMYRTATGLLDPFMGWWSWTVPVCGEIAFAFLFLNGVLLQLRKAPGGGLRAGLMALIIAASVLLQVYAARRSLPDAVGHVVVVLAFFGVMSAGKATIMLLRGGKIRSDSITFGEWAAHPIQSFRLWRWMKAWGEPSREQAQARYMRLLLVIAVAQSQVGRKPGWRRQLPVTLRYELATGYLPACPGDGWQVTLTNHVEKALGVTRSSLDRPAARDSASPLETPSATHSTETGEGTAEKTQRPASRGTAKTPDYSRRPTKDAAAKMSAEALAPYVTAWVAAGNRPTIIGVKTWFRVGEVKAKAALTSAGFLGEDAAVITLGTASARA